MSLEHSYVFRATFINQNIHLRCPMPRVTCFMFTQGNRLIKPCPLNLELILSELLYLLSSEKALFPLFLTGPTSFISPTALPSHESFSILHSSQYFLLLSLNLRSMLCLSDTSLTVYYFALSLRVMHLMHFCSTAASHFINTL